MWVDLRISEIHDYAHSILERLNLCDQKLGMYLRVENRD